MTARRWLVGAVLAVSACLPKEDSKPYACANTAQCANNWECVEGVCRQGCVGAGDCTTPGWSDTAFTCAQGHCIPVLTADSSSGPPASSGASGNSSTASSSGGSASSSSGTDSSGTSGSTSSSSGGSHSGYNHALITVTGGGGAAHGNTYTLQLSVGQPVASNPVNNPSGSKLSLGLFSTVGVP